MENVSTDTGKSSGQAMPPTVKLGLPELALVGWLAGSPDTRFAVVSRKGSMKLFEKQEPRSGDGLRPVKIWSDWDEGPESELRSWFGGKISWDTTRLVNAGLVVAHDRTPSTFGGKPTGFNEAVSDVFIPGDWNVHSTHVSLSGVSAVSWWLASGLEQHAALIKASADKMEKKRAASRMGVFGKVMGLDSKLPEEISDQLPQGFSFPLPRLHVLRPVCTATIVKETATRLYVENVVALPTSSPFWSSMLVNRHGDERYIEKRFLILDNASPSDAASLSDFDAGRNADHIERCRRTAEEILPAILRMFDRDRQAVVEHETSFSELVDRLRATKDNGAA